MADPEVAIVLGSESDLPQIKAGLELLESLGVKYEVRILSAHRSPDEVRKFARSAGRRGIKVIIACAGLSAHLPGVIASHTTLPVIGVPLPAGELKGLDAFISILQMPSGIPVATMSIGGAGVKNAVLLAAEILAIYDDKLKKKINKYRENLRKKVVEKDAKVSSMFE